MPKAIGNSIAGMYPSVFKGAAFLIDHIRMGGSMDVFTILGRQKERNPLLTFELAHRYAGDSMVLSAGAVPGT